MPITLPKPIADYFAADGRDGAAVAGCFTEDAIVVDERHTHAGREAIRLWKEEVKEKYRYISEPFAVESDGGRTIVTSRVTGQFPGSPVDLRYAFTLQGEAIAKLEIAP